MKAAVVREFGQPLVIEGRPVPSPARGQVTVRMEASGAGQGTRRGHHHRRADRGHRALAAFNDSIMEVLRGKARARIVMAP